MVNNNKKNSFFFCKLKGTDSGVLDWIISSAQNWPTEASANIEAVQNSLEHITNKLDLNILRRVIMGAGAKSPDAHSISYMQNALQQRVEGLDKDASKNTLTKVINLLNAINSVLVNRYCHFLLKKVFFSFFS